jgi:hypothetical protein
MWGLSHSRWAVIPLCLLLFSSAQLPAQSRAPRKAILVSRAKPSPLSEEPRLSEDSRTSFGQSDSHFPLVASLAHTRAPVGFKRSWAEPVRTPFVPSVGAHRQLVNFGLLLPANADHPRLSKAAEGTTDRDPTLLSSFAPEPAPPDRQIPDRFNDPQFYARHIPGVGPIVDRVFEESKAHPRITRVIKMIQPKF